MMVDSSATLAAVRTRIEAFIQTSIEEGEASLPIAPIVNAVRVATWLDGSAAKEADVPLGASKFGGSPDLPVTTPWPQVDGRPLSFLAQINLDQIPVATRDFPEKGILYFFYDATPQANTFHVDNRGRVLFEGGDFNSLERRPVPPSLPAQLVYETARVSGKLEGTLPESPSKWLPLTDDFIYDHYETLFRKHFLGRPRGLMMGWPMLIQSAEGDMESIATRRTGKQGDWVLLMQFGSSLAAPQWSWGDHGRLYYWIRREDLLERRFDSIWIFEEDH